MNVGIERMGGVAEGVCVGGGEEEECWDNGRQDRGCSSRDGEDWMSAGIGRMGGVANGVGRRGEGMLGQRQAGSAV